MPFVVCEVKECESVAGKDKLRKVIVDAGTEHGCLTIATNASNIRLGTRTVVATLGTTVEFDGEPQIVKKTNVGGILSEGMICDSVMLKWAGGAEGLCVQIPTSFAVGTLAPTSKPRMDTGSTSASASAEPELSAKELKAREKEARKKELAEKKAARIAKKASESGGGEACAAGGEEAQPDNEEDS